MKAVSRHSAEKGISMYSYLCAAAVGAFALSYPRGKKTTTSLGHAVDLLPFTKYQRERVKYCGTAIGAMNGAVDIVGGQAGDIWEVASDIAAGLKWGFESGDYINTTQLLTETGFFYRHKTIDRLIGHRSYQSIGFSYNEQIQERNLSDVWEVEELALGMNVNTLSCHIVINWGYTPNSELITNIMTSDARMTVDELNRFASDMEELMLQIKK